MIKEVSYNDILSLFKGYKEDYVISMSNNSKYYAYELNNEYIGFICILDLDTEYFKNVESTSKIKFYQDKELKDFHSIAEDILTSMKIPDFFASQIFKYKIVDNPQIFYNGNSVSFNLINTASDDKSKIVYGSLYVTKKEDKYNFIFCYGFGNFNRIFNGFNAFNLGKTNYHESMSGAVTSSIYFPNSIEESYLMHFMDLVGLKVLGNNFSIDLPYPNFN